MENNQNNFATEEEANDLLFKLIKLKDDEVFFLAKSLDAEADDNPLSNAKNLLIIFLNLIQKKKEKKK